MQMDRQGSARAVIAELANLDGIEPISRDGKTSAIRVHSRQAAEFIGGSWLEAAIYKRALNLFGAKKETEVVPGAYLAVQGRLSGRNTPPKADVEIDVAITHQDQMHVIEVKALTNDRSEKFGDTIARLAKLKASLFGHFGRVWLIAPFLDGSDMDKGNYVDRAARYG